MIIDDIAIVRKLIKCADNSPMCDGIVAVRIEVFCTNPNCTECPTSYRYYWSWFHNAAKAVDEWNETIGNLPKTVDENIQNEKSNE